MRKKRKKNRTCGFWRRTAWVPAIIIKNDYRKGSVLLVGVTDIEGL